MPQSRRRLPRAALLPHGVLSDEVFSRRAKGSGATLLAFCRDLAEVWQAHGKNTMLHTAKTQPTTFFAVCARLIPNDVRVTVEPQLPGNLSMED